MSKFFEKYGVEEYYATADLNGWLRRGAKLEIISKMDGCVSPRLGIRFDVSTGELRIFRPDSQRFLTYAEQEEAKERAEQERDRERLHRERLAAKLRSLGVDPDD